MPLTVICTGVISRSAQTICDFFGRILESANSICCHINIVIVMSLGKRTKLHSADVLKHYLPISEVKELFHVLTTDSCDIH